MVFQKTRVVTIAFTLLLFMQFQTCGAAEEGFVSLFDGKTLEGWAVRSGKATYAIVDGTIVGTTATEGPNTFLCSKREFANFELRLEVRCDAELNSGIQIRSHAYSKETPQASKPKRVRPAGTVYGYQVEIAANGNAGRIWDEARWTKWHDPEPTEKAKAAYKPDSWNEYRIVADGDRIRTWINGTAVAEMQDKLDASGFIGLQVHAVKKGAGPYSVAWRNIRIRETSVRPGINKSFADPNVAKFTERWEKEGREIYDQRDAVLKACGIKEGEAVADIGAGTGLYTRLFASSTGKTGRVYAVDISENFLAHVAETSRKEGLTNVRSVLCTQTDSKLEPNSIDLAFTCAAYHHFEFPHQTLRSIHRALRPGGRLIVIDFERIEGKTDEWILNHVRAGREIVSKEIVASGFEPAGEEKMMKDHYFLRFKKRSE